MKLVTFAVPCYNSQAYMRTCIESLLPGGEDVEIIIIDDGSTDQTGPIADEYQNAYPSIVRSVHQENAGHGGGINRGLSLAQGLYYKVVDSDDYLDPKALAVLLATIRQHLADNRQVDLYITNFVYDHKADNTRYVDHYRKYLTSGKITGWEETKKLTTWRLFLMHALVYRTEILKKSGVLLPKHTCYVDNLFAYQPLLYVKNLYYLDQDLYQYTIGRSDQTVTLENMTKHYDHQARVMSMILASHTYAEINKQTRQLRRQMFHHLHSFMGSTYFFVTQRDDPERKACLKKLWDDLRENDPDLYHKVRRMPMMIFINCFPWKAKGKISLAGYQLLARNVKLG